MGHIGEGAVITHAAAGNPNVKALVHVAASVPDTGEKLGDLVQRYPGSEIQAALDQVPFTNPDGTTGTDLYIKPDRLRDVCPADGCRVRSPMPRESAWRGRRRRPGPPPRRHRRCGSGVCERTS
ncbi:hypothetical protein [Streptomyces sp. NPDC002520]